MAPCVLCVAGPLAIGAVSTYLVQREFEARHPGSITMTSWGGSINGGSSIGYVLIAALILLFISGVIIVLRNFNPKNESDIS